ncbi:dihydrofolate reductase [Leptotrichia sp. OH3620_COT-345]|uniref:dihydrofolate reductase n=1 Tax=Leptotrichia sp. OH3620_COT-345 TaxID=2491048 RepID=UPI000F64998E|nr:dihydrofolate reductase [Leptotrichia sp. OH3620_COT-345]RRD38958.1 dihydrofolate reductase [Leptotrichia sp. OH3620_COT-345]
MFSIIVAMGKNREIGKGNRLLWHIPEDLKNFKEITMGKTVVMGRKTFESIGKALPGRKNIVISRTLTRKDEDIFQINIYNDFQNVIRDFKNVKEEVFIIGGAEIYKAALKYTDKLYISHVEFSDKEADAYFPEVNYNEWRLSEEKQFDNWKFCIYKKL